MKRFLPFLLLLCLPTAVRADPRTYPLETLVQMSDLIVVGTLGDVYEHTDGGVDYGQGRIHVREVIWGRASAGDSLLLKWSNKSTIDCPRVEHRRDAGREGIWLLTLDGDAVRADYYSELVSLSERGTVLAALAASPVVLRQAGRQARHGEPLPFTVVYRNVSDAPRTFPGVSGEGGLLRLAKGSRLEVTFYTSGEGGRPGRFSARVLSRRGAAPVAVEARGERRVELDLRGPLIDEPQEGDFFTVVLKPAGLPATNELSFYAANPEAAGGAAPAAEPEGAGRAFAASAGRWRSTPRVRAGLPRPAAHAPSYAFHKPRAPLGGAAARAPRNGVKRWQI